MHMHESTRRARNTQLVLESCGTTLTEVLKNRLRHDALSELEPKMVEVLPIAVRDATDTEPFEVDEYRMRG